MVNYDEVVSKYHSLCWNGISRNLSELLQRAEGNEVSYLEFACMLVDFELERRKNNRVKLNLTRAGFPAVKRLDEFDFKFQTTITKKQITALLDFTFIDNRENLVFIGAPGIGKTHLAIAIAIKAIEQGYKAVFFTGQELMETLDLAEKKGELKKKINALLKHDLLLIDELGYLPMNKQSMYNFFQFINAAYEYRSIIITTNKEFTAWGDFFLDEAVAVPVVDRIIHHSSLFMMGGESYRLKQKLNN